MTIADVNKLITLAERATKALEKIAKELEPSIPGLESKSDVIDKPMPMDPPLDWHSGRNR